MRSFPKPSCDVSHSLFSLIVDALPSLLNYNQNYYSRQTTLFVKETLSNS